MKNNQRIQLIIGSFFFLILIVGGWLYSTGLSGAFLLDDITNLKPLVQINQNPDHLWTEIFKMTTEGIASQLGRPIALFTFALQAHHWPHHTLPFKYVNLMIHLLNGCLIFWLLLCLTQMLKLSDRVRLLLALLTAALWILHPFQVSTVLYVIQRMTELAALFTLIALLIYVRSRQQFAQGLLSTTAFWILISIGIGFFGLLATLSKENGVLLLLYVLVLEMTLLRNWPKPRYWSIWASFFLYLPLLILVFYFIVHFDGILKGYEIRHFTVIERLFTQTRILIDYLLKILLPRPQAYGLYHDDFPISQNLFEPITTVFALSFLSLIFLFALFWRKKYPIFAFGILWFLAGHLLESSFIGLILYFEHRNYLPLLGPLFLVTYGVFWLFQSFLLSPLLRQLAILLCIFYSLSFPIITRLESNLWGQPLAQTFIWAEEHPQSRWAQSQAADALLLNGYTQKALASYQQMTQTFPNDPMPYISWLIASCTKPHLPLPNQEEVVNRLKSNKIDRTTLIALQTLLEPQMLAHCHHFRSEMLKAVLEALLANSQMTTTSYKNQIYQLYARFYAHQKRYAEAIQMIDQSLSLFPNQLSLRWQRLIWLQMEQRYAAALEEIAQIRSRLTVFSKALYADELNQGEQLIRQQIQHHENLLSH